jgi:hypothetical protein
MDTLTIMSTNQSFDCAPFMPNLKNTSYSNSCQGKPLKSGAATVSLRFATSLGYGVHGLLVFGMMAGLMALL